MFSVTWIEFDKLVSVTTPNVDAACTLCISLRAAGYAARLWHKDGSLIET